MVVNIAAIIRKIVYNVGMSLSPPLANPEKRCNCKGYKVALGTESLWLGGGKPKSAENRQAKSTRIKPIKCRRNKSTDGCFLLWHFSSFG